MKVLAMLWAAHPWQTAVGCALTISCSAAMALLIGALMWPEDPETIEEDKR